MLPLIHSHLPVLLNQTIDALLADKRDGVFVDATFGRGGHTRALLAKLGPNSRVIAFDKDPEALAIGQQLQASDNRLTMVHQSFAALEHVLSELAIANVDGIMADLGVSSPQLDDASRGFSFMHDGPLDMRMDNSSGLTAAHWLQSVEEDTLANILYTYGEERYSRRIARAIKSAGNIQKTGELAAIIKDAHPRWEKNKHPATKSFQAIRIAMNNELADLEAFLPAATVALKPYARLAVISFHSLEDRMVKQFIQKYSTEAYNDLGWPVDSGQKLLKKIDRIHATDVEIAENPRARSAWLRVAEKLAY